jgi:ubiquinone/menaquinone biosynthesis C-methylase UbiE
MSSVRHPIFARVYTAIAKPDEKGDEHRRELLAGLSGRVIEIGAGNGLNFRFYPPAVEEVVAVEPEPYLRAEAERWAPKGSVPIRVVDGVADALPSADGEFDAAVASLVLCSVADQRAALDEVRRVLRPGGELRFYEHVLAQDPRLQRTQRVIGRVWPCIGGGCHLDRDTPAAIAAAGFTVERLRRFKYAPAPFLQFVAPHVIGTARLD